MSRTAAALKPEATPTEDERLAALIRQRPGAVDEAITRAQAYHQRARSPIGPLDGVDGIWRKFEWSVRSAQSMLRNPQLSAAEAETIHVGILRSALTSAALFEEFAGLGQDGQMALIVPGSREIADTPAARAMLLSKPAMAVWLRGRDEARAEAQRRQEAQLAEQAAEAAGNAPAATLARIRAAGGDLGISTDGRSIVRTVGQLTAADREEVAEHKAALMVILSAEAIERACEDVVAYITV